MIQSENHLVNQLLGYTALQCFFECFDLALSPQKGAVADTVWWMAVSKVGNDHRNGLWNFQLKAKKCLTRDAIPDFDHC